VGLAGSCRVDLWKDLGSTRRGAALGGTHDGVPRNIRRIIAAELANRRLMQVRKEKD
jgi:hypothetical protein